MNRSVKHLERRAKSGDIKAKLQLAKFYEDGQFVDKDVDMSKKLIKEVKSEVSSQKLRLAGVKLYDYKRFEEVFLPLEEAS